MDWKGRVVFLTGASSGIGEAISLSLAARGATLGLVARRKNLLADVAERCGKAGGRARYFAVDVTDEFAVAEAAQALRNEFGKIDILIANAGINGKNATAEPFEPKSVRPVLKINFLGAVNAVGAVLPAMIERRSGHLVAISSLAGVRGLPKSAAYSASKAAMTAFFESIRLDTIYKNIDVTIIEPGFILTPLTAGRSRKMPFLMTIEKAVPLFVKAIESRSKFASFPWQLATVVKLGRLLPASLYDLLATRLSYRE